MKLPLLYLFLSLSTLLGGFAIFSKIPRRMVLGWLAVGLFQSAFFVVIGFELLGILNALFVVGSAIVLQLYSALFGTRDTHETERHTTREDWIKGIGSTLTLGAILGFALSDVEPMEKMSEELGAIRFSNGLIDHFAHLPWVLGISFFIVIVLSATIGRPAWKKVRGKSP